MDGDGGQAGWVFTRVNAPHPSLRSGWGTRRARRSRSGQSQNPHPNAPKAGALGWGTRQEMAHGTTKQAAEKRQKADSSRAKARSE